MRPSSTARRVALRSAPRWWPPYGGCKRIGPTVIDDVANTIEPLIASRPSARDAGAAWRACRSLTTAEMVVSGSGLARLHTLVARVHGVEVQVRRPEDICAEGLRAEGLCRKSLEMFCRFLGTVASSVALTTGARGGVYLAGGILPQMTAFLKGSGFRARFEAHPVMADYLASIATILMTEPYPGPRGAAEHLSTVAGTPTAAFA